MVARDASLLAQCSAIIEDVRQRGDEALIDYTRRFDGIELSELRISEESLRRSAEKADSKVVEALRLA
ncbi:MAG TPA: histidinol dehydrogenase, partial [Pyrinomonadaceae bacterium]|nr:histidinol dehydrogenase [Pyrinomonadaceae bacterium]